MVAGIPTMRFQRDRPDSTTFKERLRSINNNNAKVHSTSNALGLKLGVLQS